MQVFGVNDLEHERVLRGTLLWPRADLSDCDLIRDGVVITAKDGSLVAAGEASEITLPAGAEVRFVDGVIAPAFADLHLHWVQHRVMGKHRGPLLDWLYGSIFPAEAELEDKALCEAAADVFWKALLEAGTTCAAIYATSFESSVDACLKRARGVHTCGNSIMTRECEPPLLQEVEAAFEGVKRLHTRWGEGYAITPRFALNVGEELMAMLGAYAKTHGLNVQTHLAETPNEVEQVRKTFPAARNYTDVYKRAGLLGERTILAHCIHLDDDEWDTIQEERCIVAHCPSSNLALASGRMDLDALRRRKIDWVLASDIGAGPDLCQFDVIRAFLHQHQGKAQVSATEAFARASVLAVPMRILPKKVPSQLMLLKHEGAENAQKLMEELVDSYQGQPGALISEVLVGGASV